MFSKSRLLLRRQKASIWAKRLTPLSKTVQSYHILMCFLWSHTSNPHNKLSKMVKRRKTTIKQNCCSGCCLLANWWMSDWLLSNVGKNVGRAWIRSHNPGLTALVGTDWGTGGRQVVLRRSRIYWSFVLPFQLLKRFPNGIRILRESKLQLIT